MQCRGLTEDIGHVAGQQRHAAIGGCQRRLPSPDGDDSDAMALPQVAFKERTSGDAGPRFDGVGFDGDSGQTALECGKRRPRKVVAAEHVVVLGPDAVDETVDGLPRDEVVGENAAEDFDGGLELFRDDLVGTEVAQGGHFAGLARAQFMVQDNAKADLVTISASTEPS